MVRSSTSPVCNKIWPEMVDLPASTWPIKTMLRCSRSSCTLSSTAAFLLFFTCLVSSLFPLVETDEEIVEEDSLLLRLSTFEIFLPTSSVVAVEGPTTTGAVEEDGEDADEEDEVDEDREEADEVEADELEVDEVEVNEVEVEAGIEPSSSQDV